MGEFAIEAFTLLGIGVSFIGLRLYSRISIVGLKHLQPDDYLMVLAAVIYSVGTYLAFSVVGFWKGLANSGMTDAEREGLDPGSEEYGLRVNGSKTQVGGWCTYTFLLWVIKASICTFYLRLTVSFTRCSVVRQHSYVSQEGLEYHRRIYTGFVMLFITWIAVLLSILFACSPIQKNWQIYPNPGNFCQPAVSRVNISVTLILNVLTDIYLMSIPIPLLLKASSFRPLKKAGLVLLFSGGAFVMVAGILRCALILTDPINGARHSGSWALRETFVAVVTSNLPMVFPLFVKLARPLTGRIRPPVSQGSCAAPKYNSPSGDVKMGAAYRLEVKNPRRGSGPRSTNPLMDFSLNESVEDICIEDRDIAARQPARGELDLEAGPAGRCPSRGGVIVKQTLVEMTEMRKSQLPEDESEDIGDYYLAQQSRRGEEILGKTKTNSERVETGSNMSTARTRI
ncbi:hypothetical protein QBC44DRAFT_100121 [Cladorrhinum sp. PSN332]|nr:hypothetical protein QBC44DRAFT_100121 [Cladorrhinum sp. PSN332]